MSRGNNEQGGDRGDNVRGRGERPGVERDSGHVREVRSLHSSDERHWNDGWNEREERGRRSECGDGHKSYDRERQYFSTLQRTCVQVRLIVLRSIEEALESANQWESQDQHFDDDVNGRRKAVDQEEETYRGINSEDQFKAVCQDRDGGKAQFD